MPLGILYRCLQILFLLVTLFGLKLSWDYWTHSYIFPITRVKVEAPYRHLSADTLHGLISDYLPAGFFSLDLAGIKGSLQKNPWVDHVLLYRYWPGILSIRIYEHEAFARWGKNRILSKKGDLFKPGSDILPRELPILYDVSGKTGFVRRAYPRMQKILSAKGLKLVALKRDHQGAFRLQLSDGLVIWVDKNPEKHLQRFIDMYDVVLKREDARAIRVDMRYAHGMAVKWAPERSMMR